MIIAVIILSILLFSSLTFIAESCAWEYKAEVL